jgi:hypothetical protein
VIYGENHDLPFGRVIVSATPHVVAAETQERPADHRKFGWKRWRAPLSGDTARTVDEVINRIPEQHASDRKYIRRSWGFRLTLTAAMQ